MTEMWGYRSIIGLIWIIVVNSLVRCQANPSPSGQSYGVKVSYAQGQPIEFPDFTLEFLGQRREADPSFPRGFLYYDFQVSRGN